MKYIKLGLFLSIFLLSSCGIKHNLKPGSTLDIDKTKTVLMLGYSPNYRIHFIHGSFENDIWTRPTIDIPDINIEPVGEYIIIDTEPTSPEKPLGISMIFPFNWTGFGPCQDSMSPIFNLKPGVVNYVGDLAYSFDGQKLQYKSSINNQKAKDFLKANYPDFVKSLEFNPMKMVKVNSGVCSPKTITVPIYIGN